MRRLARKPASNARSRQDEILGHAVDLLKESGFGGLTMKRVADRVGFTETAAYRYFPSKNALVTALMKRWRATLLGVIHGIAADESIPPAERLERIVRHHVEFVMNTRGLPVLFLAEAAAECDRRRLDVVRSVLDEYLGVLESLIAKIARPNDPVRPREKALLLFGIAAATAVRLRVGVPSKTLERVPKDLIPLVIRSITR